jgi:hypothetical protein
VVDSEYASLVPLEWWFFAVSDTAKRVGERYHDVFSSPTRTGLKHIRSIVDEAALREETAKRYADDCQRSHICCLCCAVVLGEKYIFCKT